MKQVRRVFPDPRVLMVRAYTLGLSTLIPLPQECPIFLLVRSTWVFPTIIPPPQNPVVTVTTRGASLKVHRVTRVFRDQRVTMVRPRTLGLSTEPPRLVLECLTVLLARHTLVLRTTRLLQRSPLLHLITSGPSSRVLRVIQVVPGLRALVSPVLPRTTVT